MKIALVMEWSTCTKNETVFETLKKVAEANGHTVVNYGQYNMEDKMCIRDSINWLVRFPEENNRCVQLPED